MSDDNCAAPTGDERELNPGDKIMIEAEVVGINRRHDWANVRLPGGNGVVKPSALTAARLVNADTEGEPTDEQVEAAYIALRNARWLSADYGVVTRDHVRAALKAAAVTSPVPARDEWEELREREGWPTPKHMRRAADALTALTPANYAGVLRWVADRCDGLPDTEEER